MTFRCFAFSFFLSFFFFFFFFFPGELSPLADEPEPEPEPEPGASAMAALGDRPNVDHLIGEMDEAADESRRSPASSATRDLDMLMRDLQLTSRSMQMSNPPGQPDPGDPIYSRPRPVPVKASHSIDGAPKVDSMDATSTDGRASNRSTGSGSTGSSSSAGSKVVSSQTSASRLNQLDKMLGHLESDMSRQGISTSAKGTCSGCQKAIVGQVIIQTQE